MKEGRGIEFKKINKEKGKQTLNSPKGRGKHNSKTEEN